MVCHEPQSIKMESKFVLIVVLAISAQSSATAVDDRAQLQALRQKASSEFTDLISGLFDKIRNDFIHTVSGNNSVTGNDALTIEIAKNKTVDHMSNAWEAVLRGIVVIWPQASSDVDAIMAEARPRFYAETIGGIHAGHELSKNNVTSETRAQIQTMEANGLRAAQDINRRAFNLIRKYALGSSNVAAIINRATQAPIDIAISASNQIIAIVYHTPYKAIQASLDIQLSGSQTSIQDGLAEIANAQREANFSITNYVHTVFTLYETLYRLKPTNIIGSVKNLNLLHLGINL